jgi:hypothetical protein
VYASAEVRNYLGSGRRFFEGANDFGAAIRCLR